MRQLSLPVRGPGAKEKGLYSEKRGGWITSLGSMHKTRARQVPRGRAQRLQGVKGTDVTLKKQLLMDAIVLTTDARSSTPPLEYQLIGCQQDWDDCGWSRGRVFSSASQRQKSTKKKIRSTSLFTDGVATNKGLEANGQYTYTSMTAC